MTLATKNGSLILKDGKLAENCNCCGGWYCYGGGCGCSDSKPSSIFASLSFSLTQTAFGQISTGAFGGGAIHYCAKYTQDSFADITKTVELAFVSDTLNGGCVYRTPITGEYSFSPSTPVPVGFVFMEVVISCGSTGTKATVSRMNYSARPFRGLDSVLVPNNTFYAIKAPCGQEAYQESLFVVGLNSDFIAITDTRSDRTKVFSPPCPRILPTASPQPNSDFSCNSFGVFEFELIQWTPVSSDLASTVIEPLSVGFLTVTI